MSLYKNFIRTSIFYGLIGTAICGLCSCSNSTGVETETLHEYHVVYELKYDVQEVTIPLSQSSSSKAKSSSSSAVSSSSKPSVATCAPEPAVASRGDTISWKFEPAEFDTSEIFNSSFSWTFEGGIPNTVQASKAEGATVNSVVYTTSGKHTATLTVTNSQTGAQKTLACAPLQINGIPVEGCKCTAEKETVELSAGGTASWTVTGCYSIGANITGYDWTSANGYGNSAFTKLTKKGETVQPTVTVRNNEKSIVMVKCPAITAK